MHLVCLVLIALSFCIGFHSLSIANEIDQNDGWNQFRGSQRNGSVQGLPRDRLRVERIWEFPLPSQGVGGISAANDLVVVSSRDFNDQSDIFYLLSFEDGGLIFQHQYRAPGKLDFGNSPRATPVIGPSDVYLLGAFGHLSAIDPLEGKVQWKTHLVEDLGGRMPTWGYCASPLLANNMLIVQAGGPQASIVALNPETGQVVWKHPGAPSVAYASVCPLSAYDNTTSKRKSFILGCDQTGMVAWDFGSGRELWRIRPQESGEFMVPTPLVVNDQIYWLGENNGMRRYRLDDYNQAPTLQSQNLDVANDTHSPSSLGGAIVTVNQELDLLDAESLRVLDRIQHPSLDSYASVLTEMDHALVCCSDGVLLLIVKEKDQLRLIDQSIAHRNEAPVLAHAAYYEGRLLMRKSRSIVCYRVQ